MTTPRPGEAARGRRGPAPDWVLAPGSRSTRCASRCCSCRWAAASSTGPHLPLDTDTRIAVAVAEGVAAGRATTWWWRRRRLRRLGRAPVASPARSRSAPRRCGPCWSSSGRSAFPDPRAGGPYRSLVFVNGHGGNHRALGAAVASSWGERRPVSVLVAEHSGRRRARGPHRDVAAAGPRPRRSSRDERPVGATAPLADLLPRLRSGGVAAVSARRGARRRRGRLRARRVACSSDRARRATWRSAVEVS